VLFSQFGFGEIFGYFLESFGEILLKPSGHTAGHDL